MDAPASAPAADTAAIAVGRAFRHSTRSSLICGALVLVAGAISVTNGAAGLSFAGVVSSLFDWIPGIDSSLTDSQQSILMQIRLPRTVLGMLVGAGLGMAGACYQGVFRNPLADPYLLGVSAGAGFGATLAVGFDLEIGWGPFDSVAVAAFAGALIAVSAAAVIGRATTGSPATLLLGGIAVAALFAASQTFILQRLSESRAREVLNWLFGQLNTSGWREVLILGPYVMVCGGFLIIVRRQLDVMRVGDDEARSLGLNPSRSRLIILVMASLLTAAAVAVSGLIAFVGLVVPHLIRLTVSHSYRVIVPLSALVGAAWLSIADVGARTIAAPAELPVGVITAFVGAPFFAFILWRGHGDGA